MSDPYDRETDETWICDSCHEEFSSRKSWYNHAVKFGGCPNK